MFLYPKCISKYIFESAPYTVIVYINNTAHLGLDSNEGYEPYVELGYKASLTFSKTLSKKCPSLAE